MAPKKAKWASGIEMQAFNRTCDLGLAVGIDLRGNAVPLRGRFKADQPVRKDAHGHGSRGARLGAAKAAAGLREEAVNRHPATAKRDRPRCRKKGHHRRGLDNPLEVFGTFELISQHVHRRENLSVGESCSSRAPGDGLVSVFREELVELCR